MNPLSNPVKSIFLYRCFKNDSVEIATYPQSIAWRNLSNINHTKVVVAINGDAMYFSRAIIPYVRDAGSTYDF